MAMFIFIRSYILCFYLSSCGFGLMDDLWRGLDRMLISCELVIVALYGSLELSKYFDCGY